MANVAPPGLLQIFDDNGDPAAGYLLYTYDAGTTTPRTTWSDAAETTPNLNPIVLDANGRAQVYWRGNYYIELRTPANVLVWSQDNFNIPDPSAGTSIVFSNGSAATPSVRFAQATSSGLFSPAANVVAMSINGVELMRWTGTNVGIGITSPTAKLHVAGTGRFQSSLTVDAGGITVTAGGVTVTAGGMTITAGGLSVVAGGATIVGGLTVTAGVFASRGFTDNATSAQWEINAAGRMKNPGQAQLSFAARRITTAISGTGNIVFQDVAFTGGHNVATMYNVATGEATIPTGEAGDYLVMFGANANVTGAGASASVELRVNGSAVITRAFGGNDVGATSGIAIGTMLRLAQGDVVTVFVASISNCAIGIGANFSMRQLG